MLWAAPGGVLGPPWRCPGVCGRPSGCEKSVVLNVFKTTDFFLSLAGLLVLLGGARVVPGAPLGSPGATWPFPGVFPGPPWGGPGAPLGPPGGPLGRWLPLKYCQKYRQKSVVVSVNIAVNIWAAQGPPWPPPGGPSGPSGVSGGCLGLSWAPLGVVGWPFGAISGLRVGPAVGLCVL